MVEFVTPPPKTELRAALLQARRATPREVHDAEAEALCRWLPGLVGPGQTVCAYVPVGSEPGSPALLDRLLELGARVLLPVARTGADGVPLPLQWAEYQPDTLQPAGFGLREPPPPYLPAAAVSEAAVILVPALSVDRSGARLGRGAGFYDRTLGAAVAGAKLVAVVRDDEVLDELPAEPHDIRMTHVMTPTGGVALLAR
jgi:5-formyltetrahydrofolate cyclo-ligase